MDKATEEIMLIIATKDIPEPTKMMIFQEIIKKSIKKRAGELTPALVLCEVKFDSEILPIYDFCECAVGQHIVLERERNFESPFVFV